MVHNEVAAARIELDNQSTQIQDRLSELHYRMEELLSNQSPENDTDVIKGEPGQHFHMDFGFVRGSGYRIK